jgi:phosphate transport system permease protein
LPIALLAGGYLWQIVPRSVGLRFGGLPKLALIFVVLALSVPLARVLAVPFEALAFAGNIKAWLNGDIGSGIGFTAFLLFPVSALLVSVVSNVVLADLIGRLTGSRVRWAIALAALVRWIVILTAGVAVAIAAAFALAAIGFDPRGGLVGTYVQRNTLIVGFAMGFAVIPIIYTIAEDALNSVPEHLRAASLACGATPWQTATRIILPTAASGVFAAVMIGMGRAVGETMIVVMAAGNTPVLEWNIFNGLRALSANIAVELPEAVRDGTLFRMLFLAALTLFAMTFVVNTLAEIIRLRFRRRAASL